MTKNQLINILAKRAEALEKDSLLFFEDFIKLFSEKAVEGEIHFLRGVGHFFSYNGVLIDETKSGENIPAKGKKIKLVLFHETLEFIDDIYKALVIITPGEVEFEADKEEEYFSLSFGKPVISFPKKPDDFIITDHIRNLGIRASRLIKEMEYLDKRKVDEEIKVLKRKSLKFGTENSEKTTDEDSKNKDQSGSNIKASEQNSEKLTENDSTAFDLYYHSKFSQINRQDRGLPWGYSREVFGKKSDSTEGKDKTEKKKEYSDDSPRYTIENKSKDEKPASSVTGLTNPDSFQRVQKVNKQTEKETSFIDKSGKITNKKITEINIIPASPTEFSEVKSKNTTLETVSDKNQSTIDSFIQKSARKDFQIDKDPFTIRRKKIISMVLFLFVIASIFGIAYLVIQSGFLFTSNESENVVDVKRPPSVEIIERNDLIPVTYPYEKQTGQSTENGISSDALKEENKKVENKKVIETKIPNQKTEIKKDETPVVINKKPEIIPDEKPEVVNVKITPPVIENTETKTESSGNTSNTILRYKDYFVVQIGIYSSYALAESEAENFRNMGYNAIVETAQIGGETKYRLRVGDFTSFQQADRFSRKYSQ